MAVSRQPFAIEGKPSWNAPYAAETEQLLESGRFKRYAKGQSQYLSSYGPLYYAAEAIPYRIARSSSIIDRLLLMRALSTLLAGLTVLFTFLFLRELIPRTPWTWTVGALASPFQPMLGFLGGGVSNDNLLFTCAAALFFGLARAFRRGLDVPSACLIGIAGGWERRRSRPCSGFPRRGPGPDVPAAAAAAGERRAGVRPALLTFVLMVVPYALWTVISAQAGTPRARRSRPPPPAASAAWPAGCPTSGRPCSRGCRSWRTRFPTTCRGRSLQGLRRALRLVRVRLRAGLVLGRPRPPGPDPGGGGGRGRTGHPCRSPAGRGTDHLPAMELGRCCWSRWWPNYHAIFRTMLFERSVTCARCCALRRSGRLAAKGVGRWGPALGAARSRSPWAGPSSRSSSPSRASTPWNLIPDPIRVPPCSAGVPALAYAPPDLFTAFSGAQPASTLSRPTRAHEALSSHTEMTRYRPPCKDVAADAVLVSIIIPLPEQEAQTMSRAVS